MNNQEKDLLLKTIVSEVKNDPEFAALIPAAIQKGLRDAFVEANERACDMEVALAVAVAPRYKGKDEIVKGKLNKWKGKTSLDWNWLGEG